MLDGSIIGTVLCRLERPKHHSNVHIRTRLVFADVIYFCISSFIMSAAPEDFPSLDAVCQPAFK